LKVARNEALRSLSMTQGDVVMIVCQSLTRIVVAASAILVLMLPSPAHAQTGTVCGPEVKAEVAKALSAVADASDAEKLSLEAELYAKYQFCAQDAQFVSAAFVAAARECGAAVSNLGSLFYEEMSCEIGRAHV